LMGRFNEATPLQLAEQLKNLRQGLAHEVTAREQTVRLLSNRVKKIETLSHNQARLPSEEKLEHSQSSAGVEMRWSSAPNVHHVNGSNCLDLTICSGEQGFDSSGNINVPTDGFIYIEGAGDERANGTYVKAHGRVGDRPVYRHQNDPNLKIQWSTRSEVWMMDDITGLAPYKIGGARQDNSFPYDGVWEVYQNGQLPAPRTVTKVTANAELRERQNAALQEMAHLRQTSAGPYKYGDSPGNQTPVQSYSMPMQQMLMVSPGLGVRRAGSVTLNVTPAGPSSPAISSRHHISSLGGSGAARITRQPSSGPGSLSVPFHTLSGTV